MKIHNWTDGYLALRQRAVEVRGHVEHHGTDVARWPATTGGDMVAIAALFDPFVRDHCARHGELGVGARWRIATDDIARFGLPEPNEPYSENRSFWSTLAATAIYLDSIMARVPEPSTWDALCARLGDVIEHRNAGPREDGPLAHFEGIKTYDDLWIAQRKYLADKRGSDKLPPPSGFQGGLMMIPRTTNADVLQIATYWTQALADAKKVMGYDSAKQKWQVALADVEKLAKPGKPDDVYPKNNEFWRRSWTVAVQVAIGDESPKKWDLVVESVKESITKLPDTLGDATKKVTEVIADVAEVAGKIASSAGRGFLSGFGTPLLIGAGLVGLFFITRSRHGEAEG
jgi:hypothetical protein